MWAAATRTFISILAEHPFGTILWGARRWGFLTPLVEIRRHSIVWRKWCLSFGLHLNSTPPLAPAVYSFLIALRLDGPGRIFENRPRLDFRRTSESGLFFLIGRASFKGMSAGSFSGTVELRANSPFGGYLEKYTRTHARSRCSRRLPEQPLVIYEKESS